jgi:hypothetical protein
METISGFRTRHSFQIQYRDMRIGIMRRSGAVPTWTF